MAEIVGQQIIKVVILHVTNSSIHIKKNIQAQDLLLAFVKCSIIDVTQNKNSVPKQTETSDEPGQDDS